MYFKIFRARLKKKCSIEIVPLSVCPSVRLFPICSTFLHLESWKFECRLRTMHLPGVLPKFLIRGLEVLGLGPEPDPLQIGFFVSFEPKFSQNCVQYHEKWCLNQFLTDFNPYPTRKCLEVNPIPGFKYSHQNISGPMHYIKVVSLEILFVLLCSRTKVRRHHAKRAGGGWVHNSMIILFGFAI
jgi:hypothetical protein